jgi:hypothetical protein
MRRLARAQDGFAMVTVIGMLFIGLLLGAAAVQGVQPGVASAVRDQHSRRAVLAALSGVGIAKQRLNELMPDLAALLGGSLPGNICIGTALTAGGTVTLKEITATAGSWCPPVTVDLGTGTTASYQISAVTVNIQTNNLLQVTKLLSRRIVATGNSDGVKRRVILDVQTTGTVNKLGGLITPGLITGGTLNLYSTVPGSFRECRSTAISSTAPDADC